MTFGKQLGLLADLTKINLIYYTIPNLKILEFSYLAVLNFVFAKSGFFCEGGGGE